jgi:hypothetical protein
VRRSRRCRRDGRARQDREAGAHHDGIALRHEDLGDHAGGRSRHLAVDLVGRHLEQRLVDLHPVTHVLQPAGDRGLGDRLAQLGHRHVHGLVLS